MEKRGADGPRPRSDVSGPTVGPANFDQECKKCATTAQTYNALVLLAPGGGGVSYLCELPRRECPLPRGSNRSPCARVGGNARRARCTDRRRSAEISMARLGLDRRASINVHRHGSGRIGAHRRAVLRSSAWIGFDWRATVRVVEDPCHWARLIAGVACADRAVGP